MTRRPPAAVFVLLVLVGGISALFLIGSEPATEGPGASSRGGRRAETPAAAGLLAALAPRLRGLRTQGSSWEDAEVVARSLVDGRLRGTAEPPRRAILAALASADWALQWAGALGVSHYGPPDEALAAALATALGAEDPWARRAAAAMGSYARAGFERLVPGLERAARDPDGAVRAAAVRTLARRSARDVGRIPFFRDALGDAEAAVREAGAYGLAQVELQERLPPAQVEDLIGPLVAALTDESAEVRMYACMALGRAGAAGAEAIAPLLALLHDEHALVKSQAASALGSMGAVALPALERALEADDGRLASSLLWALRLVGEPALPVVDRALAHPVGVVRMQAAMKRWELEPDAAVVLPVLTAGLAAEDPETVLQAVRGLSRLGASARPALARLQALATHSEEVVRRAAASAVLLLATEDANK